MKIGFSWFVTGSGRDRLTEPIDPTAKTTPPKFCWHQLLPFLLFCMGTRTQISRTGGDYASCFRGLNRTQTYAVGVLQWNGVKRTERLAPQQSFISFKSYIFLC